MNAILIPAIYQMPYNSLRLVGGVLAMHKVGAFEAKTHLSKLLDRVAKGERIAIEKHGVPVAVLQPFDLQKRMSVSEAIEALKCFSAEHSLGDITIRELIDEGRR